ncbi:unnamed protein product [Allacma fusca]|uniref:RING-type domain-containing protein n=1 Tax=Allacma fusca TaxID=39272 RepID=A0A8J2KA70_9HEXA|nr:unnamed protein product [Allacma fusca]
MEAVKNIFDRFFKIFGVGFLNRLIVKPHPSLRFHRRYGKNIKLDDTRSVALRGGDYQHGIVFSHRPVELNEFICLKIVQTNDQWNGPLCFGFTDIDPALLRSEELERARVIYHRYFRRFWFHGLYINDCKYLAFAINESGEVTFRTDSHEEIVIPQDVTNLNPNLPLWAVVDIYGSVSSVQLVYHPMMMRRNSFDSSQDLDSSTSELDSVTSDDYPTPINRRATTPQYFTFDIAVPYPVSSGFNSPSGYSSPLSSPFDLASPSMYTSPGVDVRGNCVICLDQQVNTAYVDCGHLCICYECAGKLWEHQECEAHRSCPVCRRPARSYLRIY